MRRSQQVLAVVVVTTALYADHVAAAHAPAPVATTHQRAPRLAVRFVHRLTQSFRQAVPVTAPREDRSARLVVQAGPRPLGDQSLDVVSPPLSPFEFRLPPPVL